MSVNDLRQTFSQRLEPQWHQSAQRESLSIHYEWGRPDFGNLGGCTVHVSWDRFARKCTEGRTQYHLPFLLNTGISVPKTQSSCHCVLSRFCLTVLLKQCWVNYSSPLQLMFLYAHKQTETLTQLLYAAMTQHSYDGQTDTWKDTLRKMILWWSKYYIKTNVISTLNNLVQAITKKNKVNSIILLNLSL